MSTSSSGASAAGGVHRHRGRTPAQWYCTLAGLALTLVGILGFISDATFDTGTKINGDSFLGFEVNGWHNVVHLLSGLFLLAMARKRKTAKTGAIAFGAVYGLVTIIGLIDGNDVLGLIPVNPADNVLHAALALLGLGTGLASDADDWDDRGDRGLRAGAAGHKDADAVGGGERGGRFGRDERVAGAPTAAGAADGGRRGRQRDQRLRDH